MVVRSSLFRSFPSRAAAARAVFLWLSIGLLFSSVAACTASDEPGAGTPRIDGHYDVKGVTSVVGVADRRKIKGSIILKADGPHYKATFQLKTAFPTAAGPTDADVIGTGEGEAAGDVLTGQAQTQIVVSAVPGVDTGFAFVPRSVSTRIVSSTRARIGANGSIEIEIESKGAPGENYKSTRTRLTGMRVGDADPTRPRD